MSLGTAIKKARIDKRWKQKDLHTAIGISQRSLSQIESDNVDPRFSIIKQIATVLDISIAELAEEKLRD